VALQWPRSLSVVGGSSALAGAALLTLGVAADLAVHDRAHDALMERVSPQCAQVVAEHEAHEQANPWHRTVATGEAFLILGLVGLYASERSRRVRQDGQLDWRLDAGRAE
jgi:hypothetical protein